MFCTLLYVTPEYHLNIVWVMNEINLFSNLNINCDGEDNGKSEWNQLKYQKHQRNLKSVIIDKLVIPW